jgi:hypothetical protein
MDPAIAIRWFELVQEWDETERALKVTADPAEGERLKARLSRIKASMAEVVAEGRDARDPASDTLVVGSLKIVGEGREAEPSSKPGKRRSSATH